MAGQPDATWEPQRLRIHPLRLAAAWIVSALALLGAAAILPGIHVDGCWGALVAAALIAVLNALLPPILAALRLPFTAVFGFLLVLVVDALMLSAASDIVPHSISVDSFWWALLAALVALYSYVYGVDPDEARVAAEQRALAMRYSDQWVEEGCDLASPLIAQERAALVRSYAGLLAAVHRV